MTTTDPTPTQRLYTEAEVAELRVELERVNAMRDSLAAELVAARQGLKNEEARVSGHIKDIAKLTVELHMARTQKKQKWWRW